jgi:hypothetical protein
MAYYIYANEGPDRPADVTRLDMRDVEQARRQALLALADMARDALTEPRDSFVFRICLRDEAQALIAEYRLTLASRTA